MELHPTKPVHGQLGSHAVKLQLQSKLELVTVLGSPLVALHEGSVLLGVPCHQFLQMVPSLPRGWLGWMQFHPSLPLDPAPLEETGA